MGDFVFNIGKGAAIEKYRDAAANGIMILMDTVEADGSLADRNDLSDLLSANTEHSSSEYARKTGLAGTITVDDSNDRTDLDLSDQTFSGLSGTAVVSLIHAYEESAGDADRIPLSNHVFSVAPDGSDVTVNVNASGIIRAA